jgi:protein TonB
VEPLVEVKPIVIDVQEEDMDQPFSFLAEGAQPEGGLHAFYEFVSKKIKYPAQARRLGIEGKVFVEFIVERDGTLSNVRTIDGIGAGCDEEAARVVTMSPKWKPGKQRGKPVRQKMVIPINFKMQR